MTFINFRTLQNIHHTKGGISAAADVKHRTNPTILIDQVQMIFHLYLLSTQARLQLRYEYGERLPIS